MCANTGCAPAHSRMLRVALNATDSHVFMNPSSIIEIKSGSINMLEFKYLVFIIKMFYQQRRNTDSYAEAQCLYFINLFICNS